MTSSESLTTVVDNPADFIEPSIIRQVVERLTDEVGPTGVYSVRLAATLHRFVYSRVEYGDQLDSGVNRTTRETLLQDGKCADQALLLYALLQEADFETRITSVSQISGSDSHAYVEVGFPTASTRRLVNQLGDFYREIGVIPNGEYSYFTDESFSYFIADPVSSRYLGDKSGLIDMGYVASDGSLEINRRYTLAVPDERELDSTGTDNSEDDEGAAAAPLIK